ncbi:MAG TPA: SDR family oxidoreductase [Kofleriaceae bacterium]|nr:SDR family oxidoreductase [Kofleriaceae bacterium]
MPDQVTLITGAARNLGRALAVALGHGGNAVVVHHRGAGSAGDAAETARQVEAAGGRALIVAGDLAQVAAIRDLFDAALAAFGRIDVVINNAGMIVKKPIVEITEDDYDRSFAINARAAFFVMQEAARRIADGGRIINIGTTLLAATTAGYGVYAGSKAPLEDFTRALAREVGARGITVNTIAPGPLDTPFYHAQESPQAVAYATHASVANRLGLPSDIVPVVAFLASPGAQWLTAQTVFVNGGYLAR